MKDLFFVLLFSILFRVEVDASIEVVGNRKLLIGLVLRSEEGAQKLDAVPLPEAPNSFSKIEGVVAFLEKAVVNHLSSIKSSASMRFSLSDKVKAKEVEFKLDHEMGLHGALIELSKTGKILIVIDETEIVFIDPADDIINLDLIGKGVLIEDEVVAGWLRHIQIPTVELVDSELQKTTEHFEKIFGDMMEGREEGLVVITVDRSVRKSKINLVFNRQTSLRELLLEIAKSADTCVTFGVKRMHFGPFRVTP